MSGSVRRELARQLLETYPGLRPDGASSQALPRAVAAAGEELLRGRWDELRHASARCLGLALAVLADLQIVGRHRRLVVPQAVALTLREAYRAISESPDRDEIVEELRGLPAGSFEERERWESLLDSLAAGEVPNLPVLEAAGSSAARLPARGLELALDALDDAIRDLDGRLTEPLLRLHAALQDDDGAAVVTSLIDEVWRMTVSATPRLARVQGAAHRATEALRAAGRSGDAERIGELAVAAGALTRQAVAAGVAVQRLAVEIAGTASLAEVPLAVAARELPFDHALPTGVETDLADLGGAADGTLLELSGFVTAVTARRDADDKLVGRIDLVDASSGATATVIGVFVAFRHLGVTPGCFCQVHGVRRALLDGPGLLVDRLAAADLAEAAWRHALLASVRDWYEPYPNGHHLLWSLGPHDPRALADGTDRAGAAELLFVTPQS